MFVANFRKFWEASDIGFNRHVSMKLSPHGSGERGKRSEIVYFAAVFSQTPLGAALIFLSGFGLELVKGGPDSQGAAALICFEATTMHLAGACTVHLALVTRM